MRYLKSPVAAIRPFILAWRRGDYAILRRTIIRRLSPAGLAAVAVMLSGCNLVVMDPKGPVGLQEKDLILLAVGLMLIPVIPVIVMTLGFAWRYRASNRQATYAPDFEHSNRIEAVVWAIPCLIIIALGAVTWESTHELDPRAKLAAQAKAARVRPVEIEVVSLDWKWLFIYPEYGVASVNEIALPVGTPVHFRLTSATVMNAFFIPQLGSQIYTMTGMQTQLYLRADHAGSYDGISANYSGDGFAGMKFKANAMSNAEFDAWIARVKAAPATLDQAAYKTLAQRGLTDKPVFYAKTDADLYHHVLNGCTDGTICTDLSVSMAMAKNGKIDKLTCKQPTEQTIADATPAQTPAAASAPRKS